MARKRKEWSKIVEHAGIRIRLYERPNGSSIYFSHRTGDGRKIQKSTGLSDRKQAEQAAKDAVAMAVEDQVLGRRSDVTLGLVFRRYFELRAPYLTDRWRKAAETRRDLFERAWGASKPVHDIGQADVDRYIDLRRSGQLQPDNARGKVRDGTIEADIRWASTVFRWARGYKVNGRGLVHANPLEGLTRPREMNVRRPIASHQRFEATMKVADEVDPEGRLRCMLALARYTGHRENAICQLRASDFLRTPTHVSKALAALGQDESRADHMPHGAIRWRAESDKQGLDTVIPISDRARQELDRYLERNPRLGDAWLFPSPGKRPKKGEAPRQEPERAMRKDVAGRWLVKAEELAKLPKLAGGRWHPYRRLWATERKHLPSQDVAQAGGWGDTQALTLIYQKADPETVLKVVEAGG